MAACVVWVTARYIHQAAIWSERNLFGHLGITHADRLPTLILKADGANLVLLLRGDCRANFKSIKRLLHVRDLRLATAEEFVALTSQIPGAARPYLPGIPTLIDQQVLDQERLIGGSENFTFSIWYRTADLVRIPASQIAAIAMPAADRARLAQ